MASLTSRFCTSYLKLPQWTLLSPTVQPLINLDIVRHRKTKHWNPKFKKLRKLKVAKVELPDFQEKQDDEISEERHRSILKKQGLIPPRPWVERTFYMSCTGSIFEPYVPPEGDGKMSIISKAGAKQQVEALEKKSKLMLAVRKIRSFDEDFDVKTFCDQAQDIYLQTHTYLAQKERIKIRDFVTEKCYPMLMTNVLDKTIKWKFIKSLEPPRVVHARSTTLITKDNFYGQITVRFHTQQILAIYDRFGRLMHGSEIIAKDVLEYIVFEKHLSNVYGSWRMHDKIIPDWMPEKEPSRQTFCKSDAVIDVGLSKFAKEKEDSSLTTQTDGERPLATA